MKKLMSILTVCSLLLPSFSFAAIDSEIDMSEELSTIESTVIEVTEDADLNYLAVKFNQRIENNMNRLNRKFSRMNNRRANRIWNRIENRIDHDAIVSMDEFQLEGTAKERLVAMTNEQSIEKYQAQMRTVVSETCEVEDRAKDCLNKIRDNARQVASYDVNTGETSRHPASIRTFFCKVGQVAIGLLFIVAGVLVFPFTIGWSAPLIFVGILYATIMPDVQC